MSEAGASSDAGHVTPEGARADAAATPTRTGDTLHMHSVASTAKRARGTRVRASRGKRQCAAASVAAGVAAASAVDELIARHTQTAPHTD